MKSYLDLVKQYGHVHKKNRRATVLCITIAVCLVTAIFSMVKVGVEAQKVQAIKNFGDYHIYISNPSSDTIATISKRTDIAFQGRLEEVDDGTFQSKPAIYIAWDASEESLMETLTNQKITDGRYPKKSNEVVIDETTLKNNGLKIGDTLKIKELNGESYTIVGAYPSTLKEIQESGSAVVVLTIDNMSKLGKTIDPNRYYVTFKDGANINSAIKEIKQTCNLSDRNISENTPLLAAAGVASNSFFMKAYAIAAGLLLLVLIAACVMISNSINLNVMNRTKFFGLLRCLGASKKQIKRFVVVDGLQLCLTGIPLGLVSGYLLTLVATAILKYGIRNYNGISLFQFSLLAICIGIAVGLLTVLLSSRVPAKKASNVSPVIAAGGAASVKENAEKKPVQIGMFPVDISMGIHHATSNKKNLVLMAFSLALSIILFLGFSSFIELAGIGFKALRPDAPDITLTDQNSTNEITSELVNRIEKISGIKRVYGRMTASISATLPQNKEENVQLISYEKNQFEWAKSSLLSGEISENALNSEPVALAYKESGLKTGDKVELKTSAGLETVTVNGILSGTSGTPSANGLIVSEAIFEKLTGKDAYSTVDIQLSDTSASSNVDESIRSLISSNISLSDKVSNNANQKNMYETFVVFIYGFLFIIALVSLVNISNSMNMSVASRTNYYGVMRAVGTSVRQLKRMVVSEAIVYAACGCITGCVIGTYLHRLFYVSMITESYQIGWSVPMGLLAAVIAITILMVIISVLGPVKKISHMNIVDVVNVQ